MKKKRIKTIIIILGIILFIRGMYLLLHITPTIALRTHLFMNFHPIIALTTEIKDDEIHNKIDKEHLIKENAKCYTLTKPPYAKGTETTMRNFIVRKNGHLYFAEYYGDA